MIFLFPSWNFSDGLNKFLLPAIWWTLWVCHVMQHASFVEKRKTSFPDWRVYEAKVKWKAVMEWKLFALHVTSTIAVMASRQECTSALILFGSVAFLNVMVSISCWWTSIFVWVFSFKSLFRFSLIIFPSLASQCQYRLAAEVEVLILMMIMCWCYWCTSS